MTPQQAEDLSAYHHPISRLFAQPTTAEEWAEYALTPEQIRSFQDEGYITGVRILSEEQCDVLCRELEEVCDPTHPRHAYWYTESTEAASNTADPSRKLVHALGAWRVGVGFHDLLWAPAFRMAAYQLLGGDYRFYHDQLFSKPPVEGGVVSFHQDYSYWTWTKPQAHLTCWIGLDDANVENGCLCYVPQSHKWDLKPVTGLTGDVDAVVSSGVLSAVEADALKNTVRPMILRRGECNFHHSMMLHGSYDNVSPNPRRAAVINVFRDGVVSNMGGEKQGDMGKFGWVRKGQQCEGKYYPMLFESAAELGGDAAASTFPRNEAWIGGGMDQWERWQAQLAAAEAVDTFQGAREEETSRYVVNQPKL